MTIITLEGELYEARGYLALDFPDGTSARLMDALAQTAQRDSSTFRTPIDYGRVRITVELLDAVESDTDDDQTRD